MSGTDPTPAQTPPSKDETFRFVLVGALILVLMVGLFALGNAIIGGSSSDAVTRVDRTVTIPKGETSRTVTIAGIDSIGTVVGRSSRALPRGASVRFRKDTAKSTVTVTLTKKATRSVSVSFAVVGASGNQGDRAAGSQGYLFIVLLVAAGAAVLLGAFVVTRRTPSGSILFAAMAKVTGLLVIGGLGLVAALLASRAPDKETFTALFTLLGLIAGYLAGTRTEPQSEVVHHDGDDADQASGGVTGQPQTGQTPVGPPASSPAVVSPPLVRRRMTVTESRSLL